MPDSIRVDGQSLELNGIGVRTKTLFAIKVYVAGLYLEQRSHDATQIIATDGPRRLALRMTHDASRDKLEGEIRTGFERNSKRNAKALQQRLERFLMGLPDLEEGQSLSITYVPGQGTTVHGTGGDKVTVPGKDFADAVLWVWLGEHPIDAELARALLGAHREK